MKPDSKLAGKFKGRQRLGMIFAVAVGSAVAGDTELVKQVADFAGDNALELEAPQKIGTRTDGHGADWPFTVRRETRPYCSNRRQR